MPPYVNVNQPTTDGLGPAEPYVQLGAARKGALMDTQIERDNCGLLSSGDVRTALISGVTFRNKEVHYAVVDGLAVFEGCIVLGTVAAMEATATQLASAQRPEGVVITGSRYRWPGAIVPYEIAPSLPAQHRVMDAIAHWEEMTKVRLVRRTSANAGAYPNYVYFTPASLENSRRV